MTLGEFREKTKDYPSQIPMIMWIGDRYIGDVRFADIIAIKKRGRESLGYEETKDGDAIMGLLVE